MTGVGYEERPDEPGGRERAPGRLRVVQAFLNTVNVEAGTDLFDRPEIAARWLVDHGLADEPELTLDNSDLARIVGLREALREVLSARHDNLEVSATAQRTIAAAATDGDIAATVNQHGELVPTAEAGGLAGALARLVLFVLTASATGEWARLKVCTNDGCRWAFWDSSRNRSGKWCTMSLCGNQAKVRSYRERRS